MSTPTRDQITRATNMFVDHITTRIAAINEQQLKHVVPKALDSWDHGSPELTRMAEHQLRKRGIRVPIVATRIDNDYGLDRDGINREYRFEYQFNVGTMHLPIEGLPDAALIVTMLRKLGKAQSAAEEQRSELCREITTLQNRINTGGLAKWQTFLRRTWIPNGTTAELGKAEFAALYRTFCDVTAPAVCTR